MLLTIKIIVSFILLILLICFCFYISIPVYKFEQGTPFSGDHIYNPYLGLDSTMWKKGNFHSHPKATFRSEKDVLDAYRQTGYDILLFTDHQFINREESERPEYIPAYEHGYGINKFHKLVIGTEKVWGVDIPVMITKSQLQFIMHKLRNKAELLVLNHPEQLRVINHSVYTKLRGYDLTELNPERNKQAPSVEWDKALSSGIYSNLIANDDAHNISRRGSWFQRSFTMINTPTTAPADFISSLKSGLSYGLYVPQKVNTRDNPHEDLPRIKNIGIDSSNMIFAEFDRPAQKILFISDSGQVVSEINNSASANYSFTPQNSYVRIEAHFPNGVEILSNPFVRCDGNQPVNIFIPHIDYTLTIITNLIWLIVAGIFITAILFILGITRKQKMKLCKCNI